MKESYRENLAISSGHEPYAGSSNAPGVASSFAKATAEQVEEWGRRPAIEFRQFLSGPK